MGTPPGKICMPLLRVGAAMPLQLVLAVAGARIAWVRLLYTRSSCRPVLKGLQRLSGLESGPLSVPLMPSGYSGREMLPMALVENAFAPVKAVLPKVLEAVT